MTRFFLVWRVALGLAVLAPLGLGLTRTASAQDAPVEEARGLFEAGRAAFDAGRYEEALGYFERSYELSEAPELLYNIGHTAERLRRDERAIEAFERFLEARPDAEGRAAIEVRIANMRAAVAEREASDAAREEAEREAAAERERAAAAVAATESESQASSEAGIGGWVVAGIGGAAAIAGAVLLGLAESQAAVVRDAPANTPWSDVAGAHADADTFGIAGAVLLGVGGAALVAGLIWGVIELPGDADAEVAFGASHVLIQGRL